MDLAIVDTLLFAVDDDRLGIVEDGAVGVRDGELVYVGPSDGLDPGDADRVVDGSRHVTMPGLVNAHAHTGLTLLRGGAQDVPEIEWMNRALGPLARHLTPDDEVCGARLGVLEAVRSGVTTVCEYATDVGRLVEDVYRPLGVRAVATETVNEVPADRSDHDPGEPYPLDRGKGEAALERAEALFEAYATDELVTPAYGPQALDMVSPDLLATIRDRAARHGRPVHMHVAQGERERLQVRARYGTGSTVSVLDEHGVLSGRLVAAHLHGATPRERALLVEAGASMVGCPGSIAAIDGVAPPVEEYREAGGTVGIGTDQAPGPGGHDLLRELRTAGLLSKADRGDPTALPAWEALRLATIEGARALGIDDRVGSLEPGKRADLVMVDREAPSMTPSVSTPFHTAVPNLVYSATAAAVDAVVVDGAWLVRDGAVVAADAAAVAADARRRAERAFGDAAADWRAAGSALVERADEGWL